MTNTIHFFRIDRDGKYHEFKLIHYLSIKSFAVNNPECSINLWTNRDIVSPWIDLLENELFNRFNLIKIDIEDFTFDKYDCISHYVDYLKLYTAKHHRGLSIDTDYICIKNLNNLFNKTCVVSEERDPLSHKFSQLALGFIYNQDIECKFINDWLGSFDNYEKGKGWTYWAGIIPTELYNTGKYDQEIKILPESLTDPYTYTRDRLANLFLHNRNIEGSYMFHVAESIAWDRFLKPLDLEHIMTVNTTFTKVVRPFVTHLWDFDKNMPKINYI